MARRFADTGKIVLFVLFCLSLSISVLVTDERFSAIQLKDAAIGPTVQYLDFVFGQASLPEEFTGAEASHMRDVAWLLRFAAILAFISGITLVKVAKIVEWRGISKNALIIFGVSAVLALIIPFDSVFRTFHVIFFPQGNWMFPADSVLITFYPQSFFAWYAAAWLVHAMITAITIHLFARLLVR